MGGSSIAGLLLQSYLYDEDVELIVIQDYSLPKFIDNTCLIDKSWRFSDGTK